MNMKTKISAALVAVEARAFHRLMATDRRSAGRKIFLELYKYFSRHMQFNSVDGSIRFDCEAEPILVILKKLGFTPKGEQSKNGQNRFHRSDVDVIVRVPHTDWNPILTVDVN